MHAWSTVFKWRKKLNLPPKQEVESVIHQHACLQYTNVTTPISLAETEGIQFLCHWWHQLTFFFSFKALSPISLIVSKWLWYVDAFDCAPKTIIQSSDLPSFACIFFIYKTSIRSISIPKFIMECKWMKKVKCFKIYLEHFKHYISTI